MSLSPCVSSVQMGSSNCFVISKVVLMECMFDERLPFVYEDLEMTYRAYRAGISLIYLPEIAILHNQRTKTAIEQSYIGDCASAYQK